VAIEVAVLELGSRGPWRLGDDRTSTSLVLSRSVSICHVGLMSQHWTTLLWPRHDLISLEPGRHHRFGQEGGRFSGNPAAAMASAGSEKKRA
jgi:hypothetical protein